MNFGIFTKEKNEAKKAEAESADIYIPATEYTLSA